MIAEGVTGTAELVLLRVVAMESSPRIGIGWLALVPELRTCSASRATLRVFSLE